VDKKSQGGRSHLSPVCPQKKEREKKENEGLTLNYASIVSPLWRAHSGEFFNSSFSLLFLSSSLVFHPQCNKRKKARKELHATFTTV